MLMDMVKMDLQNANHVLPEIAEVVEIVEVAEIAEAVEIVEIEDNIV